MRLVGDNGEGEDSGSGAGKEGDGEVKGEGDEPGRIFLADWPAEGLDPGRLDPLEDLPRRPQRPGRGRADPLRLGAASGEGIRAATPGG